MTGGDQRSFGVGVMFLIGILAGVALATAAGIFLLGIRWATPLAAEPVISDSPSPSASPTVQGDVSDACVRSAEYNLEADEAVDELAEGAESQDARAVEEALDRLQQAREVADGAAEECLAQAGRTSPTGGSASPAPSPSPTS